MATPRGIGFADEAEKASNFIIAGEGCGKKTCDSGVSGVLCVRERIDGRPVTAAGLFRLYIQALYSGSIRAALRLCIKALFRLY